MGCVFACCSRRRRHRYSPLKKRTRKGLTLNEHRARIILLDKQKQGKISAADLLMLKELTSRYRGKANGFDDDGSALINRLIEAQWELMAKKAMDEAMKETYSMGHGYDLRITSGTLTEPPSLERLQIMDSAKGEPMVMAIQLVYDGKPEVDILLQAAAGHLMPEVKIDLHWLQMRAALIAEVDLPRKISKVYFSSTPEIKWSLDIDVTNFHLPLPIESLLEKKVEMTCATIREENPLIVPLGSSDEQLKDKMRTKLRGVLNTQGKARFTPKEIEVIVDTVHIPQDGSLEDEKKKVCFDVKDIDDDAKEGSVNSPLNMVSISADPRYKDKSLEEIRLENLRRSVPPLPPRHHQSSAHKPSGQQNPLLGSQSKANGERSAALASTTATSSKHKSSIPIRAPEQKNTAFVVVDLKKQKQIKAPSGEHIGSI